MTIATMAEPTPEMRAQSALIERLKAIACEAIDNERPGIEYEPRRLRSITVEIELSGGGVTVGNVYLQRRGKAG